MINGVWSNPLRLGITDFKRRPNIVGLVDVYRSPSTKIRNIRRVEITVGPKTYNVRKTAVRWCTDEEVAAYALGWRADNEKALAKYPNFYPF